MYCNQCGAKLSDDAKFCQNCGSAVDAQPSSREGVGSSCSDDPSVATKEKKLNRGPSPRLKKLLAILGGAVVLILAIVLISNAVDGKKRTTILGTIPDPETFFGVSGDHDRYDSWYEHNIEFETEDVTKDMTDAYVDLLGSSKFPFVLDETIDHFGGGMVRYIFKYNGSQELYDAQSRQIMVEYNPGYEQVVVNIRNSGNFELVPVEPYAPESVSEENTEPAYAPDPEQAETQSGDNGMAEPELVAGPISVENKIEVPQNAVPELSAWSGGAATVDRVITKSDKLANYEVSAEVLAEYVQMLQETGFELVDEYYFSYGDTFQAWAFNCLALPEAETIEMQYDEDTRCHVCIWTSDDDEYRIDISPAFQFFDTGLRRGGAVTRETISGPSAGAGLYRMPDGSYQTSDGRLSTAVGNAMVIRDGATYTCGARWLVEDEDERLWVEDYYRNEGFFMEVPKSSLMEGDVLLMSDFVRERYYETDKESLESYNWHTPMFALAYDGIWKGPELNGRDFQALTVRVMYYQSGGEAVYYVYARTTSAEPGEVEALVAVDMSAGSGGNFGNATRLSVGDSFSLNYSGEVFGANYHVYEWTVTDGEGNVRIEGTGSKCRVEALEKGVATVKVTYEYGVDEPDILTGIVGPASKSKTQSYNFIIE